MLCLVQPTAAALPYKIMHGLWGMVQMMFTKYIIVVDDECLRTATRRSQHQRSPLPPLRQHRPATRQHGGRSQELTKGPSDVLDHATIEIASGSKLGIDATKKLAGESFKRPWPKLIKMDAMVRKAIDARFGLAEIEL